MWRWNQHDIIITVTWFFVLSFMIFRNLKNHTMRFSNLDLILHPFFSWFSWHELDLEVPTSFLQGDFHWFSTNNSKRKKQETASLSSPSQSATQVTKRTLRKALYVGALCSSMFLQCIYFPNRFKESILFDLIKPKIE